MTIDRNSNTPILPAPATMPSRRHRTTQAVHQGALISHVRILGGIGSGKTRLAARRIIWDHLRQGISVFCLDPSGQIFANIVDKIRRYPPEVQDELWKRTVYINAGSTEFSFGVPFYYRLSKSESLYTVAQRPITTMLTLDPALSQASVEGANALRRVASFGGMLVAAIGEMNYQMESVASLIRTPKIWQPLFAPALEKYQELHEAVTFFNYYADLKSEALRARYADSFLIKLLPVLNDPANRSMFCSTDNFLDFEKFARQGKSVFIDFSSMIDSDMKQLKMLIFFHRLLEFTKSRYLSGREGPRVMIAIDELNNLQGADSENNILSHQISELISVYARNCAVSLLMIHQSLNQLDPKIQGALSLMSTQIIGSINDADDALTLSRQLTFYDSTLLRKEEPIYAQTESTSSSTSEGQSGGFSMYGSSSSNSSETSRSRTVSHNEAIDHKTIEYTVLEQEKMMSDEFLKIEQLDFKIRASRWEGDFAAPLRPGTIRDMDKGQYPSEASVLYAQRALEQARGRSVSGVNAEITARLEAPPALQSQFAILTADEQNRDLQTAEEEHDDYAWYDEFEEKEIPPKPDTAR